MALTPGKAKKMLDDGTVHGRGLTDKQKRYFGAIAGGATPMKKINGGWLDKYQEGGTIKVESRDDPRYQSYQDSLNLYKAYQFQKNNTPGEASRELPLNYLPGDGENYNPDKVDINYWKYLRAEKQRLKDLSDAASAAGDYDSETHDNYIQFSKKHLNQLAGSSPINLENAEEMGRIRGPGFTMLPSDFKIIDYYRSLGISDKNINFYHSPDIYHPRIKPIAHYNDGQAMSPVFKKPTQLVEIQKSILNELDSSGITPINVSNSIEASQINVPRIPTSYEATISPDANMANPNPSWMSKEINVEGDEKRMEELLKMYGNSRSRDIQINPKYKMGGSLPGASGMMYGRSNTMPPLFTQSEMKAPSFADSLTKAQEGDEFTLVPEGGIPLDEVVVTAPKYKYEYKKPEHLKHDPEWWNTEFKGTLDEYNEKYGTDYKEGSALGDYIMDQYYRPQWNEMMQNRDEMQMNALKIIGTATSPLLGPSAVGAIKNVIRPIAPYVSRAWNYTPFKGPGFQPTVGNAVNTGFLADGIRRLPGSISNMVDDPSWSNAGWLGLNALEVGIPGNTGLPYFKPGVGGKAPFIEDLGRSITANTKAGREYQQRAQKTLQQGDMWSNKYFNNPITRSRMADEMGSSLNTTPRSISGQANLSMNPAEVVSDYKKLMGDISSDDRIAMVLKYQKMNPNLLLTPNNIGNHLSVNVSRYNRRSPGFTQSTLNPIETTNGISNTLGRYSHLYNDRVVDIGNPSFTGLGSTYKDFGTNLKSTFFGKSKLYDNAKLNDIYQATIHEGDHFYRVGSQGNLPATDIKLLMPFKQGLINKYGKYMSESGEILLKSDAALALKKSDPEAFQKLKFAKYAGTAPEINARITQIRNQYNIRPGDQVDMSTVEEIIRAGKSGELGKGLDENFAEFFNFIDDIQGNVPGSAATTKEWLQGILMNMSKTGSKIKPLKYGGNVDKAQEGEKKRKVLGFDNVLDYIVETRKGNRDMWGEVADTIAYHESGHTMNPKQKQIGGGPGRGAFQFEGPSLITAQNRYKTVAKVMGVDIDPNILNAKSADQLSLKDQYTLFYVNMLESDATLGDYPEGKIDLTDLWIQGHKNIEVEGNRESFLHSRETAKEKGIEGGYKTFKTGGWLDKYEVIEDDMGQLTNPGKITKINSPNITMKGVDFPVLGISDTGDKKMMQPGKDYKFDGNSVTEYPMAQTGYKIPTRQGVRNNVDGSESTHLMKAEQLEDGTWVGFPSLFQNKDGQWIDMSGEEDWMNIYNEALNRGEVIEFGDDKEAAIKFGEGSWKIPKGQEGETVDVSEQIDFLKNWNMSNRGQELLSNSFDGNQKLITDRTNRRNNFLDTVSVEQADGGDDYLGRYNPGRHRIRLDNSLFDGDFKFVGKGLKDVALHELSHSQDYSGGASGAFNKLNMPLSDVKLINSLNKTNIRNLKNNKDLSKSDVSELKYIGDPTEVRARLNAIRYFYENTGLKEEGMPSIFDSEVTPEMQDIMKINDQYKDLNKLYSDDEINMLLNTISDNSQSSGPSNMAYAQEGAGVNEEGVKQYKWFKNYLQSPKYVERLKKEFPDYTNEQIGQEIKTRLENVMQTRVGFLPRSSDISTGVGGVQGVYDADEYPGSIMLRPEYSASTSDVLFEPGNYLSGYNTIPLHEWSHAADDGGNRMPQSTTDLMLSRMKENSLDIPKDQYYYTRPTEYLGRMQPLRYLMEQEGLYDAGTQDFTKEDLEKAKQNKTIKNNVHFQDLMKNVNSDEDFIELMNTVASVNQKDNSRTMMAKQGRSLVSLDQLTNFTNYNTPQPGGWLDKY